ncbi:MAG: hypothetical protein FJ254_05275 [Phycisphaerae bacterium]|nr:hypothetical protein [Phycisphaerae bacterium]
MQLIALAVAALTTAGPDFARDVAPMLERCCLHCHRPGGPGAYDFTRPAEVKRVSRTLLTVIESGLMPPFLPVDGVVSVPPKPTADEISALKDWVERGAAIDGAVELQSAVPSVTREPIAAWDVADGWTIGANDNRQMRSFIVGVADRPLVVGGWRVRAKTPGLIARALLCAGDAKFAQSLDERDASLGFKLTGDLETRPAGGIGGVGIDGEFVLPDGFAISIAAAESIVAECHTDGRGRSECGQFRLEALPPVMVGESPVRLLRAVTVGGAGTERESCVGETVTIVAPPNERDLDLVAIVLRPGMYASRVRLLAVGPDGRATTILRIDRWNGHVDRPYLVDPPFRLARGTRLSLETVAENAVLAKRSTPQAVLLVADAITPTLSSSPTLSPSPTPSPSPAEPTESKETAAPSLPAGPATAAFLASTVECGKDGAKRLATPLVPATVYREVFGVDPEPRTGPTQAAGLTWFEAVDLCNELSRRAGLEPAYRVEFAERDGARLMSAVVTPLGSSGWRLPSEMEWIETNDCRGGLSGDLWNWTSDAEGSARIVRGGCWADAPGTQGKNARSSAPPATRNELFGARLVRTPAGR